MIKWCSYALALIITIAITVSFMVSSNAQGFDMFSFFSKKSKDVASSVHPQLKATLTSMPDLPLDSAVETQRSGQCRTAMVTREPNLSLSLQSTPVDPMQTAYVWQSGNSSIGLINNPSEGRFDVWDLDSANHMKPKTKHRVDGLGNGSDNWISFSVVDHACLPNQKLLVAVNYYDPRSKIALYILDLNTLTFTLYSNVEPHAQELDRYFEQQSLSEQQKIIVYYSDTKRQSAEIYHNYYNHVAVFSTQYPNGIEVLKLGIDDGNIKRWWVDKNQLYVHSVDNRNSNNPKTFFWSLDLSNLLKD